MRSSLDMSLDDIIDKKRTLEATGSGRTRRVLNRNTTTPSPYTMRNEMQDREMIMMQTGVYTGVYTGDSEAILYISNLDYGVSTHDIELLFSDVGELRSQSVHYDKSGRSKGTAEVVFARQIDALAAMEKYNHRPLDGKPMMIELVGADSFTATSNMGKPSDVFTRLSHSSGQESFAARDQGLGGVHDRELTKTQGQGRCHCKKPTAEELDADIERYHFEAINLKKFS